MLHWGYSLILETEASSCAWPNLDSSKLVKLDAVGERELLKEGKKPELFHILMHLLLEASVMIGSKRKRQGENLSPPLRFNYAAF